jgi:hypothetical protein
VTVRVGGLPSARGWCAALVWACLVCGALQAGEGEYLFRDRGIVKGPLRFSPGVRLDTVYSDNVLNDTNNRRDDVLQVYVASLDLSFRPSELAVIKFQYAPHWYDYALGVVDDYFTHNASGSVTLGNLFNNQFHLGINASFNESQNTSLLEDELLAFQFYKNLAYGINAGYAIPHGSITASFNRSSVMYTSPDAAASSVSTQDSSLTGTYAVFARHLNLTISYNVAQTLPNDAAPAVDPTVPEENGSLSVNSPTGADTHTLLTGVKGQISRFSYDVGFGLATSQIIYEGPSPRNPVMRLNLEYRPHERITTSILITRGESTDARLGRAIKRDDNGNPVILNKGETSKQQSLSEFAKVKYTPNSRMDFNFELGHYSVTGISTGGSTDTSLAVMGELAITTRGKFSAAVSQALSERSTGDQTTQTYGVGFNWRFGSYGTASISAEHAEKHVSNDPIGTSIQSDTLDTVVNKAQIGVTFSW